MLYFNSTNGFIIFIIKHTKHDNRTVLIRAFKFTTNEDGNYHTQYP